MDVIDLGLGEPDFPTPAHVIETAHKAALAGEMLDTAAAGTPALRKAVAEKFRRENGPAPFIRISTATSDEVLTEAIARVARAVAALQPAEVIA